MARVTGNYVNYVNYYEHNRFYYTINTRFANDIPFLTRIIR